jgi:hypothetical protein
MFFMDTERELVEIKKLVNENNKILKNLQSRARIHTTIYIVKWIVIILAALGIYTVIQPVIESVVGTYGSLRDAAATISEVKNSIPDPESSGILNFFKNGN